MDYKLHACSPRNGKLIVTDSAVRDNAATSGQLKIVTITNRGVGLGTANRTYTKSSHQR